MWESQCLELDFLKEVPIILITIIFGFFLLFPLLSPVAMDLQEGTCHLMVSVLVAKKSMHQIHTRPR